GSSPHGAAGFITRLQAGPKWRIGCYSQEGGDMRWTPGNGSNIEDARGRSVGGGFGIPLGIGGVLVLLVGSWLTGINLFSLVGSGGSTSTDASYSRPVSSTPEEEKKIDFVDAVMADVQQSWQQRLGTRYQPTKVRL